MNEQTLINFLKQFQTPREAIIGNELINLQGAAYLLYKELTNSCQQQTEIDALKIRFETDKEYNIMFECTVLLLTQDMLRNITPALSVAIPRQELEEVKEKLREWVNKLSNRIEVKNE